MCDFRAGLRVDGPGGAFEAQARELAERLLERAEGELRAERLLHLVELGKSANFRQLVLGCMDSYDSDQRRILLHFSRSTRFASFCTAAISSLADFSQFFFA